MVGGYNFYEFAECECSLVLFRLLNETIASVFVTEYLDHRGDAATNVAIAHIIQEVFIMCEYMFDAIRGAFVSGIMGLMETDKRDSIPIRKPTLFDVILKQQLVF